MRACTCVRVNVIPTNRTYSHDYKDIHNHQYYHKYPHNQYHSTSFSFSSTITTALLKKDIASLLLLSLASSIVSTVSQAF